MSQFIGQYGSLLTDSYQQPEGAKQPLARAYGNYLGAHVPSLGADDPSRQRPTAYVLPRQIELLNGFFTEQPQNTEYGFDPTQSNVAFMSVTPPKQLALLQATGIPIQQQNAYGLNYNHQLNAQSCVQQGCQVTNAGGCQCAASTVYFSPSS